MNIEKILTAAPGTGGDFADEVYNLFYEYRDTYNREEWPRLDGNERMYQGDHWHDVDTKDQNAPRPTTPIIFSTIENIRADLTDEYPEASIKPETSADEVTAKILTEVIGQSLEVCDYDKEYDNLTHDLLVGGWMAQEIGWDSSLNQSRGGAFIRYVSNKNIMYDPYCVDLQDSRAVFKFDRLPKAWFASHYPGIELESDSETVAKEHGEFKNTVRPDGEDFFILIEAWFRVYSENEHQIHMLKLAGRKVLENSALIKPNGYFAHGMYPFIITPLYEQKGTSLGLGIVDMFKNMQQYSDKVDQIILKNALTAGHNRFIVQEDAVDVDDLKDYSKEVIKTNANPNAVMAWIQDRPLPSHMLAYADQKRAYIKEESGSNDFSRGNVSSGVTAASAITALQEMSSKRSRMEARRIHYGFKQAVRMMIDVIREFESFPREVIITINGKPQPIQLEAEAYRRLGSDIDGTTQPIEYSITIAPTRQTRYTKLAFNQMILEFMAMFQGQLDPIIMLEALDVPDIEPILEKMRTAQSQGIMVLQQQIAELSQALEAATGENVQLKGALNAVQRTIPEQLAIDAGTPAENMVLPT